MVLSSRLGEYGITGAFFMFLQAIGFILVDRAGSDQLAHATIKYLASLLSQAPALATPFASLIAALALVLVFFVGLAIDLLGFFAPQFEVVAFKRKISSQASWLNDMLESHRGLLGHDIDKLAQLKTPLTYTQYVKALFTTVPIFSARFWKIYGQNWSGLPVVGPYERLFGFLLVSALDAANPSSAQLLHDQLNLWRLSRAIATALIVVVIEGLILALIIFLPGTVDVDFWSLLIAEAGLTGCAILALSLIVRSFRQLCDTTFAVLFLKRTSTNGGR